MLGKNNFKERLRRMEEQNKKERFSIRKLSIGAASVLIGFAFMGMGAQTVQADQVTSTVKQEFKAAGDQDTVKIDQPAVNTPAADQIITPKTGEVPKQATEKQVEATVKPATETKNNNSEQNKKPQTVNKNDAKNVQTEAQKANGQTTQADQSQNRTSNSESTTNDQHNANSENVELAKNDQVKNQNSQVTDKSSDIDNAVNDLQKAMNQATVLASKTNLNQNLTAEQKSQLQQIDEIVSSGQALVDRYNTQKMQGQALAVSLRSNPENNDNRGNGNSANAQTLNVSRLSKITHNLNGLMPRLYEVRNTYVNDGQVIQTISTADDFQKAIRDQTTVSMFLLNDIDLSNSAYNLSVSDGKPFLQIGARTDRSITLKMGNNRIFTERPNITVRNLTLDTSGGGGFQLGSADLTTIFENCNFKNINGNFINGYNNTIGNTLHFKGNNRIISTGNLGSSAFSIFSGGNIIVDGSFVSDSVLPQSLFYSLGLTVNGTLKAKYNYNATRNPFINIYGYAVNYGVHFGSNTNIDISGTGSSAFGVTNASGANISFDIPSGAEVNLNSGSSTPIYSDLDVSSHVNINLQGNNSKLSLSGSNGIIAGDPGVEVTANNGSSLIINTTGTQNDNLTITANNPKLVSLRTTGGSIDTSHVNFNTNQQAGLYLGKADGRVGSWKVSGIRGTVGNATISSSVGYWGKTPFSEISQKGMASANYKYSSDREYHDLTSDNSFSDLIYSTDEDKTRLRTKAERDDVTADVVTAHAVDENGKEKLESADQYVRVADTSLVTNIKWVNNVITQNSYNNYYPTNSTSTTPVSTQAGAITVDSDGNATLNNAIGTVGINGSNATIAVTYQDGTVDYVPVKINIVSAKAKNGSVQTTETSSQTNPISVNFKEPSDTNATGLIANGSDLSQWSPEYSFVDAAGNPITAFGSGTNITGDPNHKLVETNIKVQYHNGGADDGTQTIQHVWLKVEKTTADRYTNDVTSAGIDKVLQGATFDAQDAVKVNGEAASHLATTNPYSWTTTPVLQSSGANAGKYVGTAQVKFSDGSVKDVQVIYSQVAKSSAKTGLVFNADGLEADARADATKGLFNTNNKGQGLITIVNDNTADGLNLDGLTNPIAAGSHNVTVKVKVADDVWTKGVTTGATNNKGGFYNVDVPVNVQNMNTAYEGHITYNEAAPIKGHIVNYGTTEQKYDQFQNTSSNFADFLNVTDSAGTTNLTTEQKKGIIKSFEWVTAPRTATAGEKDATLKVVFADNSVSDLIRVKVNIASGASVTLSQHVKSGSKITDTNFPQPTSVSLSGGYTQGTGSKWVNVYHDGTNDFYIDRSGNPDRIMWHEAEGTQPVHDSQTLYYKVVYSDGSAEVVPVTAQITPMKDWMGSDIQVDSSVTFHNAQLDYAPDGYTNPEDPSQNGKTLVKYNGTNVTYVDEYHTSNEDIKSINWQNSDNINDLLNPEHVTSATTTSPENIQITFSDGSKLEKSVSVSVISALGHDATINALPSNAASDDSALAEILHQAISNKSTIDNYVYASDPSSYQIINPASGNDLSLDDLKKKQTNLPLHILVNYKDGSSQEVDVKLNVNGIGDQLDQAHNVHGESDVEAHVVNTGDMSDAANYANSLLSTSDTITYTDASGVHNHVSLTSLGADRISWTTAPDLTQIDSNGTDHEVTVHFSDNSTANIKFKLKIVGANTSDLTHAIYGGHTSPAAQAQISNREDLATKFGTSDSSYSWYKKDEHGNYVRMSDTDFNEVISSGNEDNAWIKVDWGDGTSQMAGLKLNLTNEAGNHTPGTGTTGRHPVDPQDPTGQQYYVDGNDIYVHVNGNVPSAEQVVKVTDAQGQPVTSGYTISGWTAPSTGAAVDQAENLTITYSDGTTNTLNLHVHVVGADSTDLTHAIYGGHTSPAAKDQISNTGDLATKFGTSDSSYSWYKKDEHGNYVRMSDTDFNEVISSGNEDNAWIKVDWGDGTSQMTGLKLNLTNDSGNHTPGTVDPGSRPVDPHDPNGQHFYVGTGDNVYVHVNGNVPSAEQVVKVTDAQGQPVTSGYTISGWRPIDTTNAGNHDEALTITYGDGTQGHVTIHVNVVGANTSDLTHAIYGGHTSPAAQAQISNREDLATKFGTSDSSYSWYKKDEHGNYVRMSDTDFNEVISSGNEDNAWIKVDWGDGTSQMAGLKLNLLSYHDAYHPTPRPIPVTPGENPTDITNPTPEEPTPGVDPNTVPSGSHTILDPSQPAPDTTTPGTHPVHVIVVYPDGSQSDPIETNIVVPDENTPSYEDTSVGETISPVIIFRDNHDKAIKTLTDKISGYEGSTIPLETLKKLIAEEMPEGYALDMDLEQAWREGKFVITVNHPIYIKIVKVRRQLVLFVDKRGRIVKRAYVLIKESQKLSNEVVKSLTGKDMPKGYKMNGYKKVAKHIDIFVSGKQTKATSHGKLVLYVRKDGKIVKKLNIQLVANKFSKRNAKMHLPKGYKMTGHTHINRHNDVWVIKK